MAKKRIGKYTVKLDNPPSITGTASIVGPKEAEGPLAKGFTKIIDDEYWGESSWEKAEAKLLKESVIEATKSAQVSISDVNYICAGDLLNQCISSTFGIRDLNIPFYGLYGACSTCAESLGLGALLIDGGYADTVVATTSSHFCSAERQFRLPLEQGGQRPLTSQWTITGSGAFVLSNLGSGPYISHVTTGKIVDMGISDANNMGAAMAPAAADTIFNHFTDTGFKETDYDLIITGDLGSVGHAITDDLLKKSGLNISDRYSDCGILIFDGQKQDTHAGGSGCGCSAAVMASYIYSGLKSGLYKNILFVGTGALLSSTSSLQGETIPCIAHAITVQTALS